MSSKSLDSAYSAIENKQVDDLSERMGRLFRQIAANVSDDDFTDAQPNKATLRMIAQVGVRPVEASADKFEVFALNSRSRAMPPVQINGASRRVMALSFVLALCIESRTPRPAHRRLPAQFHVRSCPAQHSSSHLRALQPADPAANWLRPRSPVRSRDRDATRRSHVHPHRPMGRHRRRQRR